MKRNHKGRRDDRKDDRPLRRKGEGRDRIVAGHLIGIALFITTLGVVGLSMPPATNAEGEEAGIVSPSAQRLEEVILSTTTPVVGGTITTTLVPNGATATYYWFESNAAWTDTAEIPGATASSYTPTEDDIGRYLHCLATGSGAYYDSDWDSTTAPVVGLLNSLALSEYSPVLGTQITAILNPAQGTADFSWYRSGQADISSGVPIAGANDITYTPTEDDVGSYLICIASGSGDYRGSVQAMTSSPVIAHGSPDTGGTAPSAPTENVTAAPSALPKTSDGIITILGNRVGSLAARLASSTATL